MSNETPKRLLPSALSIYEKDANQQLNYSDVQRTDMHFRLKTGADILIEENGIHTKNPFGNDHISIYKWSESQNDNIDVVLQNYSKYFNKVKDKYESEFRPIYRPYITTDGFDDNENFSDFLPDERMDKIIAHNKAIIDRLRLTDDSIDAIAEIDHRRNNIFEVLYYKNSKNLDNLLLKTYVDDLTLTNRVTILQNYRERGPKENEEGVMMPATYAHKQRTYTIGEMLEILKDPNLNKRDKSDRLLVIPNTTGDRQIGEIAFTNWTGLQVFDIDLKFSPTFISKDLDAGEVRDILFDKLKHYPWLLGITLSSSGKALHIYTKVSRPHHLFETLEHNIGISQYWYRMSYIQKYAAISYALFHFCDIDIYDENERKDKKIIDGAMAQPRQGIAMNYDPEAKWNRNFIDLPPMLFYHLPPEKGIEITDWLDNEHMTKTFMWWLEEADSKNKVEKGIKIERVGSLNIVADFNYQLNDIGQIDMDALGKGEKYSTRWRVCNTLIAAFGESDKTKELAYHVLQGEKTRSKGQINSFLRSAVLNRKEADMYMLKQLRTLGLKISLDEESTKVVSDENMEKIRFMIEKSNYDFRKHKPNVIVNLKDKEYLGMRMNQIINSFDQFKINVIESAPNTGKTEFFKSLAKTNAVCLVIPFTSTIESKIVNDESICELFDVYYGDKSVSDIKKGRSVVMTFDKFSNLPKSKYKLFNFIAIDESHLLFTSTYRLPVVSQTVENLRTYLLKDSAIVKNAMSSILSVQHLLSFVDQQETSVYLPKLILMSGTVTAELDYFKYYDLLNYIKIQKKHPHAKNVEFVLSKSGATRDYLIFQHISTVLGRGGKIIHPSNRGDGYARKVVECVEHILGRKIKWEYYKRANTDESFLERINKDTTVDEIELLFCSDYLSVGIDIKDVGDFEFVYSSDMTAESIEQFNNRLRSTDINCKIFFDVLSDDGMQKSNIMNLEQIEYKATNEFRNMLDDEMTIAKLQQHVNAKQSYHAVIGEMFSKYFVQDMFGNIKYVQAAFEIERFEDAYKDIARSLLYIKTSLDKKFQYDVKVTFEEEVSESTIEKYKELQKSAKAEYDRMKSKSMIEIIEFVSRNNIYDIVAKKEVIFVKDNDDIDESDIGLHLGFDSEESDGQFIITYNRRHKIVFDESFKIAKKLRKLYSANTVGAIMKTCTSDSGIVKKIEVKRYLSLMKLMFDDRKSMLASNTRQMLSIVYEHLPDGIDKHKIDKFEFEELKYALKDNIRKRVFEITENELTSERRIQTIESLTTKFIDTLFHKHVSKENVSLTFRKIFPFDSDHINERIKRDQIFNRLLMNDYEEIDPNALHDISEEHVDDSNKQFGL